MLLNLWGELEMPRLRAQLERETQEEVAAKRLHSCPQYHEILEDYDDHEPLREGAEGALRDVVDAAAG